MRPIRTHFLLLVSLFLLNLPVFGQNLITTFTPTATNVTVGSTLSLELKVTNFTSITSVQFPITYNSSVLQFVNITGATLPGFAASNYNATNGKVTISWFPDLAQYPTGYTAPSNTTIFTMNFTVAATGTATVNIANVSPGIEVTRNGQNIQVTYATGGSNITATSNPATQFKVTANTIHIPKGQVGCMPVTVTNFTDMVSLSYIMHWDSSVLQYQNTKNWNLIDLGASNFNLFPAGSNNLIMSWFEQALTGITKPNGTAIYEVCFLAKGAVGSSSMVTINGTGFPPGGGPAEAITKASVDVWGPTSGVSDTMFVIAPPPDPNAVTFTADKDTTIVGGMTCVDVRVKNFKDILSAQFGITYDQTKIQFKSPIQFGTNPLGLTAANFNTNVPGEIKFTWFDQNALGIDLNDSTIIFSICFNAIGAAGTTSPFNIVSLTGLPIEVVKEPGGEVTPNVNNGHVHILAFIPPVVELVPTAANCNSSATGKITAKLIQGGPVITYTYTGSGIPGGTLTTTDTVVTNLMPGTYTVTVSVAGGITATSDTIVVAPPAIASAVSINNVTCNGGMNGAINQTPSGGTPPYSYKWAGNPALPGGNPTTQNLANLKLGIYTLTITDSKGCTFVTPPPGINVTQPSAIMVNDNLVNVAHVACKGGATGSITLPNPSGGTGSHTFVWSNMKTTLNNPNIAAGTYTITVSDANLCTKTFSYTVNEPSLPLSITQSGTPTKVSCFGSNNGTGAVSVSGGTPNYLISWRLNNPTGQVVDTGFTADKLFPGTYVPVVTDDKGCTAALGSPITIIGPSAPITASSSSQNVKCFGANNGSITLTPTGGNSAPFTIAWTGGLTGSPISNLAPGTYTPTVTDAGGCTAIMGPVTITSPQALTFPDTTITPQDGMTLGSITIVTPINGGTSPFTFSWSGPGGFSAATQNITGLLAGVYTVTITDANNCTLVGTVEVPSTNLLIGASVSPVQASCNDDGCMTINIPPAAAEPILITLNCASLPSRTYFPDKDTFQICNLPACVYQVTISDASGNTFTIPAINVAQLQQAIVGDSRTEPFDDLKNGQIKLNPVPSNANLTYKWNYNGLIGNTISNLDSGTYIVTVTNVTSGCTAVYTYHLPRTYQTFSCNILSITPTTCIDADKGAVAISVQGGDGPTYTYAWSGPGGYTAATKDIANLLPGTYTCTVTDESLVPRTCPVAVVTSQSQIAVTNVNVTTNYNGFDVSGASVCDGGATVVFSGQVGNTTVAWSNSGTGPSNSTLCAGAYTITVTDQLGCTATWGGTLTAPTTVVGSYTILSDYNGYAVSCNDECDGSASVSAVGGVPPYRIAWSTQQVDANVPLGGFSQANNLCGGDYTVTITDKNNVVTVFTVTIDEPDPLIIQFASVPPENFGRCDGEVIADVPAGVGNLTFTWSTNLGKNGTGARADDLCPGEQVMFVVIDANGCTANGTVQMAYPDDGCLQVRPAITPASADGNNDYVLITCIEDYPDNTFEIYNRWGQLVDVITGYNNGDRRWEGLRNGLLLPEGAYFFVLKFLDKDGVAQQIKGSVTLIR